MQHWKNRLFSGGFKFGYSDFLMSEYSLNVVELSSYPCWGDIVLTKALLRPSCFEQVSTNTDSRSARDIIINFHMNNIFGSVAQSVE